MKALKFAALVIIIAGIAVLGAGGALWYFNEPPAAPGEEEFFRISRGENLTRIARGLEAHGFIRSARAMEYYSRFKGTAGLMKTGYYRIAPGSTMSEIHNLLLSGQQVLYRVTIPEGWTIRQIARILEEKGITGAEDFIAAAEDGKRLVPYGFDVDTAEGFLYPDTYSFPLDFPAGKVVDTMVETFFQVLEEVEPEYGKMTGGELYDKIILSSIVEREYRVADEAPMIASVFYNRLETDMSLGSCATIVYIITDIEGKPHPESLLYSDLEIPSDYNTYIHTGLPPAPISNPGLTALDAAFHPAKSDYFYFLLQDADAGRHFFSRTYGEHNQAYTLYIKKR